MFYFSLGQLGVLHHLHAHNCDGWMKDYTVEINVWSQKSRVEFKRFCLGPNLRKISPKIQLKKPKFKTPKSSQMFVVAQKLLLIKKDGQSFSPTLPSTHYIFISSDIHYYMVYKMETCSNIC